MQNHSKTEGVREQLTLIFISALQHAYQKVYQQTRKFSKYQSSVWIARFHLSSKYEAEYSDFVKVEFSTRKVRTIVWRLRNRSYTIGDRRKGG